MITPPLSQKTIIRILAVLVVILSLVAGYYESLSYTYARKLTVLQNRYESALELIPSEERTLEDGSLQPLQTDSESSLGQ